MNQKAAPPAKSFRPQAPPAKAARRHGYSRGPSIPSSHFARLVSSIVPDRPDGGRWQIAVDGLDCLRSTSEGFVEEIFADSLV